MKILNDNTMNLVVIMITPQWLKTKGGPTNYVKNLKLNLEESGNKVFIFSSEDYNEVFKFSNKPIVRDCQIIKNLCRISPDIIHIHGRIHYIPAALLYKHLFNKKTRIVFTFHTQPHLKNYLIITDNQKEPYKGFKGKIGFKLVKNCDKVVSVSESIIQNLNEYFSAKINDYSIIQSGASEAVLEEAVINKFKTDFLKDNPFPILSSIGVFSWDWKVLGHQVSIEAIRILKEKYPNIKLLIVGDGPYKDYLVGLVESLELKRNVIFCGTLESPSVVLALSDIYVHMASNEGSPLALIEAMMSKKAIICANKGGIPEIIQNEQTGILIEPLSLALAEKLTELIENKDKRLILGLRAYSYVVENHSWKRISQNYLSLYNKIR